jgi:hypothetical protein
MSKPYDATIKDLLETAPADWLSFLGHPTVAPVRLIDADLSTVTTQADKVFRIDEAYPWLLHLELQTGRDGLLPWRARKYNALLAERHGLPVSSVIVLLREHADGPELDGLLRETHRIDGREHLFPYVVVRLWRQPVGSLLQGGVGTLPLAPLCVTSDALPPVVERMRERLAGEHPALRA